MSSGYVCHQGIDRSGPMYLKPILKQNLPVTTKYPLMVAEIFPHFEYGTLPPFGKENLWFL